MFFIYHFITLDEKRVEVVSEPSGKVITQAIDEGITNPQLLSTMITTAIGKWGQIKIAGESIQRRLGSENIIDLMKNYDYPNETDYVILGEINTLSKNYEIDLKIMDVSTQDIILSHAFQIPKDAIEELRNKIDEEVSGFMYNLLKPFCGFVSIKVDDSSRDFLRWDYISIRPLKTQVGGKIINTEEKDLKIVEISRGSGINGLLKTYYLKSTNNEYQDYGIVWDETFKTIPLGLLFGDYELVAFLNGNKDKYQTFFKVIPGQMTQIDITIDYQPPPPPQKMAPASGYIEVSNIKDGVNISISNKDESRIIFNAFEKDNKLTVIYKDEQIQNTFSSSSLFLENINLGKYIIGAYAISNETFPGKYYTILFSFEDTVIIEKRNQTAQLTLPNKKITEGREVIIYLNPFPSDPNEKYKLYVNESNTPFAVVTNAGEVHIKGVSPTFDGTFTVIRDGYEKSTISVEPGNEKLYKLADLTQKRKLVSTFSIPTPTLPSFSRPEVKIPTFTKPEKPSETEDDSSYKKPKQTESIKSKIKRSIGLAVLNPTIVNLDVGLSQGKLGINAIIGILESAMEYNISYRFKSRNLFNKIRFIYGSQEWGTQTYSYKGVLLTKTRLLSQKFLTADIGLRIGDSVRTGGATYFDGPQLSMRLSYIYEF